MARFEELEMTMRPQEETKEEFVMRATREMALDLVDLKKYMGGDSLRKTYFRTDKDDEEAFEDAMTATMDAAHDDSRPRVHRRLPTRSAKLAAEAIWDRDSKSWSTRKTRKRGMSEIPSDWASRADTTKEYADVVPDAAPAAFTAIFRRATDGRAGYEILAVDWVPRGEEAESDDHPSRRYGPRARRLESTDHSL